VKEQPRLRGAYVLVKRQRDRSSIGHRRSERTNREITTILQKFPDYSRSVELKYRIESKRNLLKAGVNVNKDGGSQVRLPEGRAADAWQARRPHGAESIVMLILNFGELI